MACVGWFVAPPLRCAAAVCESCCTAGREGTPSGNFGGVFFATFVFGTIGPGSMCLVCSLTMTGPSFGSNRAIRLTSVCGPPAASHGSQKLYDGPISVSLIRSAN